MEFWRLIGKGMECYDKKMFEEAERLFDQAIQLRKEGEWLVFVIKQTRNFNCLFTNSTAEFDIYFGLIVSTVQKANQGEITGETADYILERLTDIKTMFYKTVAFHGYKLGMQTYFHDEDNSLEEEQRNVVELYDAFKDYLKENKEKIQTVLGNIGKQYNISQSDVRYILVLCYMILLGSYEVHGSSNNGYRADTFSIDGGNGFSSSETTIRENITYHEFQLPRLDLIGKESYRSLYIDELKELLAACEIPEKGLLQFQREFQTSVFQYMDGSLLQLFKFDPFVNKKILGLSQEKSEQWLPYLILCFFLGMLGVHSFYIGLKRKGALQLVLTLTVVGELISFPWVVYDFFKALIKKELPEK